MGYGGFSTMYNVTPARIFGPLGRRVTDLCASLRGRGLACHHIPQNYASGDHQYCCFRQAGGTYEAAGDLPPAPSLPGFHAGRMQRPGFAPLDDGQCLCLETGHNLVELVRYAPAAAGPMVEVARWEVWRACNLTDATLHLLPSGQEAVVEMGERDDGYTDWTGGPTPVYTDTRLIVNLQTGEKRKEPAAPPARRTRLVEEAQVIEIATGATLLRIENDQPDLSRLRACPCFHALSPDENYALSTVAGGHFALWNVSYQSPWQPALPAHGGVHCAVFLPGGRAALGTVTGGIIVVDCTPGIAPGDAPW